MKRVFVLSSICVLTGCANVPFGSLPPADLKIRPDTSKTPLAKMVRLAQSHHQNAMTEIEKLSNITTADDEETVESIDGEFQQSTEAKEPEETQNTVKNTEQTPTKLNLALDTMRPPVGDPTASGVYDLNDGVEAFAVRNALIKNAQKTLDLQYYSLKSGLSTRLLIRELVLAADRGVQIRILLDDMETLGNDQEMSRLAAHPNIELRVFNPIKRWRGTRLSRTLMFLGHLKTMHRRMHNKIWIADGVLGIAGGRNLGDRYFNASEHDNFSDLDVLLAGQVLTPLNRAFEDYWQSDNAISMDVFQKGPADLSRKALRSLILKTNKLTSSERVLHHPYLTALKKAENHILPDVLPNMFWGDVQLTVDSPEKINHSPVSAQPDLPTEQHTDPQTPVFNDMVRAIADAHSELILVNPYFAPGDEFIDLMLDLVKRGRRVTLITNSLESNDVPLVNGPYDAYRLRLLKGGVQIYELRAIPDADKIPQWRHSIFTWKGSRASLHTKAAIIDGRISFVGSMNLDPRAIIWNTELGLTIRQAEFSESLRQQLLTATDPRYSYHVQIDANDKLTWLSTGSARERSEALPAKTVPIATQLKTKEPGSLWRRLQKWVGKLMPERYL